MSLHWKWIWLVASALGFLGARGESYSVRRRTAEEGLPQNRISCICQTTDGYLWFGTWFGLVRFDGYQPTIFDQSNTPELGDDTISGLVEDPRDGTLWIGTDAGLVRYRDHRFVRMEGGAAISLDPTALWLTPSGNLWFHSTSSNALVRVRGDQIDVFSCPTNTPDDRLVPKMPMRWLEELSPSRLLVVLSVGVFEFDLTTGHFRRHPASDRIPAGEIIKVALRDRDGRLWLGTRLGLFVSAANDRELRIPFSVIPTSNGETNLWITSLEVDDTGSLWAHADRRGLHRFSNGQLWLTEGDAGLTHSRVTCLKHDREGNIWAGTQVGIVQLRPKHVTTYTEADGLSDNDVWCVHQAADGTVWIGTDKGISFARNGKIESLTGPYFDQAPPGNQRVQVLFAQRPDRVWFGQDSLMLWEDGRVGEAAIPFEKDHKAVKAMFEDSARNMWFGLAGRAVRWDGSTARVVKTTTQLVDPPDVRVIHEDHRGNLWFGTYGDGLKLLTSKGAVETFATPDGKLNNQMWTIYEDVDGIFWIGTEDGLNRFVPPGVKPLLDASPNPQRFFTYRWKQGLREKVINHVLEDDAGNLWLGGLHGIYRASRNKLNRVADAHEKEAQFTPLGGEDGLLSVETNGERSPSACKTRDGKLWFPTDVGIAVIDPSIITSRTNAPNVLLESVVIDEEYIIGGPADSQAAGSAPAAAANLKYDALVRRDEPIRLEPGRARAVRFRYTAPTMAGAEKLRFRPFLKNLESEPPEPGSERAAYYTNLRPGEYTFYVSVVDGQGNEGQLPKPFVFILAPHFWQTWPFYILSGLAFIGLASAIQGYRLGVQRRIGRLEQAAALERERSRIAQDLHDELGSGLAHVALLADLPTDQAALHRRPQDVAREMLKKLDSIVWALNPAKSDSESVIDYLVGFAEEFVGTTTIQLRLNVPTQFPLFNFDAARRHQLLLAFKEALRNAVTHSKANNLIIELAFVDRNLKIVVRDDGIGFDPSKTGGKRNGLANLRRRASNVGGSADIRSAVGQGTEIVLSIPAGDGQSRH